MALQFSPVITARRKVHSDGFSFFNLNERFYGGMIDPILNIDHFRMSERVFPPRPLAGFSAVTMVFETSESGFRARDHLGLDTMIEPGGVYALVSGSGMVAEETPPPGMSCEGIHISINLPSKHKRSAPESFHLSPSQVREWKPNPQIRARVILGKLAGVEAERKLPEPFTMIEFQARPKMSANPRVLAGTGGLIYVLRGKLRVSCGDEVNSLDAYQSIGFQNEEKDVELFIESLEDSHFFFFSGRSCKEPMITHGPFVMNTQAEIADAIARYQRGEMGKLDPSP
jgi:redox-sensitive bicupin YhaK (pirin superfamily)